MTPKERAAMQQALEALENAYENGFLTGITGLKTIDTITAMRKALAEQAEHEPVAERKAQVNELIKESAKLILSISDEGDRYLTAVDTLRNAYRLGLKDAAPVRTKDLTDDEIDAFIDRAWDKQMSMPEIIRAVIAADRSKNGIV